MCTSPNLYHHHKKRMKNNSDKPTLEGLKKDFSSCREGLVKEKYLASAEWGERKKGAAVG